jgi:hypothetical protein
MDRRGGRGQRSEDENLVRGQPAPTRPSTWLKGAGADSLASLEMISQITGRQPPHMRPARHTRATWRTLRAPSRTAWRIDRSLTPWQ